MIYDAYTQAVCEAYTTAQPSLPQPPSTHDPLISRFLALPGELRNLIYRHALVEPDNIKISKTHKPAQPGILQVNRQCRKEAGDVYYHDNTFAFQISHFDAEVYVAWCKSSSRRRWCSTKALVSRSQNWANLLSWLAAYFREECGGIVGDAQSKANADAKAAVHLFSMVKKMRKLPGMTWDEAADLLEDAHSALAEIKPRWAWRHGTNDLVTNLV